MGSMAPVSQLETVQTLSRGVVGVDEPNKKLLGYIVAEKGPFKSLRGEFTTESLQKIAEMANASQLGLKARFTHPGLSSDGLGTHLGRATNFRMDGENVLRADLTFADVAFNGPKGNLAGYVMELAKTDPSALGSSLVITPNQEYRLNADGTRQKNADGEPLPPIWYPKKLYASDIVDEADATTALLSANVNIEELEDSHIRQVWEILNTTFAGQDRLTVQSRVQAFLSRYLDNRFGPEKKPDTASTPDSQEQEQRLQQRLRKLRCLELADY